jgi:phage minor structural protein
MIVSFQIRDEKNDFIAFIDQTEFSSFSREYAINGSHFIDLVIDLNHPYKDYFIRRNRFFYKDEDSAKWFCFVIQGIKRDETIQLHCESYLYELCSCLIPNLQISGNTVLTGLTKILTTSYPRSSIQIGTTDIIGTFDMSHIKQSAKYDLFAWAEKVGGEISERIEWSDQTPVFYVDILSRIGSDTGVMRYDDLDLSNYSENEPVDDYYTAAFGFGLIENDVQLTFENIEWLVSNGDPVDKPLGQAHVTLSDTLKEQYGIYVSGEYQHRYYSYEDTQISDAAQLLQATYDWLISNILSKTEYSVDDYDVDHEVNCGDSITLVLTRYDTRFNARSIKIVEDMLTGKRKHDFNFKTKYITDTISQVASTAKAAVVTASAAKVTADKNYISSVLDRMNSEINAGSAYIYQSVEDGWSCYNAYPDAATEVLNIKGGALRIANSKTDGDWNYTTVATGSAVVMSKAFVGALEINTMTFDIDGGRIYFGKRIDGVIDNPIIDFTIDGIVVLGAETNNNITGTGIEITRADNGEVAANFGKDGGFITNMTIGNQMILGNLKEFKLDENTVYKTFIRRA